MRVLKPIWNWITGQASLLSEAYDRWCEDDGWLMASAVAYYASLSFFPIVLLLITGMGLYFDFTEGGRDAEAEIVEVIEEQVSPTVGEQVAEVLDQVSDEVTVSGPLAIGGLLFTAIAIFAQFDTAFDRIWGVRDDRTLGMLASIRYVLFVRLVAFLMLGGLAVLVLGVFTIGLVIQAARDRLPLPGYFWAVVNFITPLLLNVLTFAVVYRVLPKVRVKWYEAFRGAVFAALLWELGRWLLASFLIGDRYSTSYAVIGSFIAVMLWIYYAVAVLFFGAEYIQSFCRHCRRLEVDLQEDDAVQLQEDVVGDRLDAEQAIADQDAADARAADARTAAEETATEETATEETAAEESAT